MPLSSPVAATTSGTAPPAAAGGASAAHLAHLAALQHRNRLLKARAAAKVGPEQQQLAQREAGFALQTRGANAHRSAAPAPQLPPRRIVGASRPVSQGVAPTASLHAASAGEPGAPALRRAARPASAFGAPQSSSLAAATAGAWGAAELDATLLLATAGGGKLRVGRADAGGASLAPPLQEQPPSRSPLAATAASLASPGPLLPGSRFTNAVLPADEAALRALVPLVRAKAAPLGARRAVRGAPADKAGDGVTLTRAVDELASAAGGGGPFFGVQCAAGQEAAPQACVGAVDVAAPVVVDPAVGVVDAGGPHVAAPALQAASAPAAGDTSGYGSSASSVDGAAGRPPWLANLYALKRDMRALKRPAPGRKAVDRKSVV